MTQAQVLDILDKGQSVFLTGAAGSGKTYVLEKFIKRARSIGKRVAVTATTGLAASHLNGRTIHAWSGMGITDELTSTMLNRLKNNRSLRDNIANTDILIIDEISMLHRHRLDMVNRICCFLRASERPFGGLQVILCGDFFQLPPVERGQENQLLPGTRLAIHAEAWQLLQPVICYLNTQYRQSSDDPLLHILNALRHNQLTNDHLHSLHSRRRANPGNVTELYCHNQDTDLINRRKLEALPGQAAVFAADIIDASSNKNLSRQLLKNCLANDKLQLKENALVMFIKNDPQQKYINGTLGKVIGFNRSNRYPIVRTKQGRTIYTEKVSWRTEDNGRTLAELKQIPLKLAWAITIHKSQGLTLEAAFIDLSRTFEPGMGYVALSRLKNLDNLYLKDFNEAALRMNQEVLAIDQQLRAASRAFVQKKMP